MYYKWTYDVPKNIHEIEKKERIEQSKENLLSIIFDKVGGSKDDVRDAFDKILPFTIIGLAWLVPFYVILEYTFKKVK